jgi:hypothetical protein
MIIYLQEIGNVAIFPKNRKPVILSPMIKKTAMADEYRLNKPNFDMNSDSLSS